MKSINIFSLMTSILFMTVHATPVIINDTGAWNGEIQANEEGFLVYNMGMWTQYGVNFHSGETILTFADDFSPVITNVGTNYVTCTYNQVGWIWPYGGPTLEETISFETRNLVISVSSTLQSNSYEIAMLDLTGPKSAADFPANGVLSFSESLKTFNPIIIGIGERASWMGSGLSVISLFCGPFAIYPSAAALILDLSSRFIDTVATIKQIDFSGTYAPASPPTGSQTWRVKGIAKAKLQRLNVEMYDDNDNDGYVSTGASTIEHFPYLTDIFKTYEMEIWN
mgnify:CR=1 FL=1